MLSNSGETDELVLLTPQLKRQGAKIIALTGNEHSSLAQAADVHLDAAVDAEACPLGLAPTASTTATLALGDALALALLDARGFSVEDFARSHPGGPLGRRLLTHVRDVMVTGRALPMVGVGATLAQAIVAMSGKGMGMTAVVDDAGRVAGIFTDGDLRRCLDRDARHRRREGRRRHDAHAADDRSGPARDRLRRPDGGGAQGDGAARHRRRSPVGRRAASARPVSRAGGVMTADALLQQARGIRLLTCDVDGVLTDGRIYVGDDGREPKAFSVLDGVGLKMLMRAGITVAWITGSNAPAVTHRARALGVARVVQGAEDKLTPWEALRIELGLPPTACAHIGDDLPDVPVFVRCGFAVTVPHAPAVVRAHAHCVTGRDGGRGAVRELCEMILAAQGVLDPQHAALRSLDRPWSRLARASTAWSPGRPCFARQSRGAHVLAGRAGATSGRRASTARRATTPISTSRTSAR